MWVQGSTEDAGRVGAWESLHDIRAEARKDSYKCCKPGGLKPSGL